MEMEVLKSMEYLKYDFHGLTLEDAKEEILLILEECSVLDEFKILLIYGYNHGKILKNYFESRFFIEEMALEGYKIRRETISKNPGASYLWSEGKIT